jgi:anti-sigma28 factor (negative regulator of flagellin synthesis)
MEADAGNADSETELIKQPTPLGEGNPNMRLSQIQEQIGRGEYQVDTQAVADAIVRKLLQEQKMTGVEHKRGQAECS